MLHPVELYVSRTDVSRAFWTGILTRTGWEQSASWEDGFTLVSGDDAYLIFVQVANRYQSHRYHRCGVGLNHLAFRVRSREEVDALKQYCTENNIPDLYADRYPFANGGKDYYALFIEDPDRIKVEFVVSG
jgi:catechol 2,3-dioxygenase-like lactoylglutathione lyase family enzyme